MSSIHLFTIGFTQKTAEYFFDTLLKGNQISVLVDTRLSPDSQLSVFAKQRDLPFFLKQLVGSEYRHLAEMSPTKEILSAYRKDKSWENYEQHFNQLLNDRQLIKQLEPEKDWWFNNRACLLCSEHEPDFCHRRLVAEYMAKHWPEVEIHHLM